MQGATTAILFASNYSATSPGGKRFQKLYQQYKDGIPSISNIEFIFASSNDEIIDRLESCRDRIIAFHFEGREENYKKLLDACVSSLNIGSLSTYLSELPKLQFVFLSGSATEDYVNILEDAGVKAIVMSSRRITVAEIAQFCDVYYEQFFGGASIQEAVTKARKAIQIEGGLTNRIFVGVRGTEQGKQWRLPAQTVGTLDPKMVGWYPEQKLPLKPFPGNRPYQSNEAGIFLGRRSESQEKGESLRSNREKPILVLHGQAGIGKTSFLDAGILSYLRAAISEECRIIQLCGRNTIDIFEDLCTQIGVSSLASPREIWRTSNVIHTKALIITIDQCENLLPNRNKEVRLDFSQVLMAIRSLISDPSEIPFRRVILCCRTVDLEACDMVLRDSGLEEQREIDQLFPLERNQIIEVVEGFRLNKDLNKQYNIKIENGLATQIANDLLSDPGSSIAPFLQAILCTLFETSQRLEPQNPSLTLASYTQLSRDELLFDALCQNQLIELRKQWKPFAKSGIGTGLLTFHTFLFELTQSRSIKSLQSQYPHQSAAIVVLVSRLTDLYLLTDSQRENQYISRLGFKALLSPLVRHLYPESRSLELLRWFFVNLTYFPEYIWLGVSSWFSWLKHVLPKHWTSFRQAIPRFWKDFIAIFGWLFQFSFVAGMLLMLLSFGLRSILSRNDLTPQIGNLQSSAVFQLQRSTDPHSILRNVVEILSGFHPLLASDIAFSRVHFLTSKAHLSANSEKGKITELSFVPNSDQLYSIDSKTGLHNWDFLRGTLAHYLPQPTEPQSIFLSKNGTKSLIKYPTGVIAVQSLEIAQIVSLQYRYDDIQAASFSQDGQLLAIVSNDGMATIFDTNSSTPIQSILINSKRLTVIAVDSIYRQVAFPDANNNILVWNINSNQQTHFLTGHFARINALNFSSDGQKLLSGSSDETVRLWKLVDHMEEYRFNDSTDAINSAVFGNQDKLIFAGGDDNILRVWDINTYLLLDAVEAEQAGITTIATSNNSQLVASGGWDGSIHLWAITTAGYVGR